MEFRFAKSNVRHLRNHLAAGYFILLLVVLGFFGGIHTYSPLYFVSFAVAIALVISLWYVHTHRLQERLDRGMQAVISFSTDGISFTEPAALDNLPQRKQTLRFVDAEAFRLDRPYGPKTVVIRLKGGKLFVFPPLENLDSFVRELRGHLPEEKRSGPFGLGRVWRRV